MHKSIAGLFDTEVNAPTTLVELTKEQHTRYKDNCIHLSGLYVLDNNTMYYKATYGKSVSLTKKNIDYGGINKSMSYHIINLSKTKKKFMMITCSKADCQKLFPSASSRISILSNENKTTKICSGIVVIMLSILPHEINILHAKKWNNDAISQIRSCKKMSSQPMIITEQQENAIPSATDLYTRTTMVSQLVSM